jgi:hypothetical protein
MMEIVELVERLTKCATGGRDRYQASPDTCREAAQALRDQQEEIARRSWQPIETAPKDGQSVLVVDMTSAQPTATIVHWKQHDAWGPEPVWLIGHGMDWPPRYRRIPREMNQAAADLGVMLSPTHWMPLPEPPARTLSQEGRG